MAVADADWVPAVKLLRPQGRRGEILAEPQMDVANLAPGTTLWAGSESAAPDASASFGIEEAWQPTGRNVGRIVLKLAGVDTISAAEALEGRMLWLRASDLPALPEDTFRVRDLVGCSLWNGDDCMGVVADVQFPVAPDGRSRLAEAPDLLAVIPAGADEAGDPVLVPFVQAWLVSIEPHLKRIVMHLPAGLFETVGETIGEDLLPSSPDQPHPDED